MLATCLPRRAETHDFNVNVTESRVTGRASELQRLFRDDSTGYCPLEQLQTIQDCTSYLFRYPQLMLQNPLAPRQLYTYSFACSAQLPTHNKHEPPATLSVPGRDLAKSAPACIFVVRSWYTVRQRSPVELTTCRCLLKPSLQMLYVGIPAACARGHLAAFSSSVFLLK